MAHAGAKSTKVKAPAKTPKSSDPDVAQAVRNIEARKYTSTNVSGWVQDEMLKLNPEQQKELYKHLPQDVKVRVEREIFEGYPVHPSVHLARTGAMSDAELKSAAADMRAGPVHDQTAQLAIGAELAARTAWGKEHPDVVAHQKQLIADGKVTLTDGYGQGQTDQKGNVRLDTELLASPEAFAAIFAHEAQHSYNAVNGGMNKSTYQEETSGNMASARVWAELGDANDPALSSSKSGDKSSQKRLDTLNDYATRYKSHGEDGVQARVAAEYAKSAKERYKANQKKAGESTTAADVLKYSGYAAEHAVDVRKIVAELADDPGAQKAMTDGYVWELAMAVTHTGGDAADLEALGRALKNAPQSVKDYVQNEMAVDLGKSRHDAMVRGMNE
jgi:hypothetical protein